MVEDLPSCPQCHRDTKQAVGVPTTRKFAHDEMQTEQHTRHLLEVDRDYWESYAHKLEKDLATLKRAITGGGGGY